MTRHRTIVLTLAVTAAIASLPASALGSSLLSGYGGPGAGDQAILGSALVNGPRGGGGGPAVGIQAPATSNIGGDGNSTAPQTGSRGGDRTPSRHAGAARRGTGSTGGTGKASAGAPAAYKYSVDRQDEGSSTASDDPTTLGLSGLDLLLIALVAGGLVLTGGLTRRLVRAQS